jgi:Na+-transporting methylmalonyl-CoA/oxaloacetate decarboxylase gamma subunit
MDGLTVSFITLIITVVISLFIACLVKLMSVVLDRFSKPHKEPEQAANIRVFRNEANIAAVIAIADTLVFRDEAYIAAVIAIANSKN